MRIRKMRAGEEEAVSAVAIDAFRDAVAPTFSQEGIRVFEAYAAPGALGQRRDAGNDVLVAFEGERPVGMAEVRGGCHLAMLFVLAEARGKGVGRKLVARVRRDCLRRAPYPDGITVNASTNAVDAYRVFGFEATGGERTVNGIRHVPMTLPLRQR